ncbi:MAG: DUF5596 domain-containing protein [Clostridia bacterium]|nr:DUF5596 domain-containing protein [Clostridia bacterium]
MKHSIQELMAALACEKWPDRWQNFFEDERALLVQNGHPLLDPSFYDELQEKYRVLPTYKDLYKRSAALIAADEDLSLFFALLCRASRDRDLINDDLANLSLPTGAGGQNALACRMLPGLTLCQAIPDVYEAMKKRGIPDDILYPSLRVAEAGVDFYVARHDGEEGFSNYGWWQRAYDGIIYRVGRLELEVPYKFPSTYNVFRHENGETVALAKDMKLHRDGFAFGSVEYTDEEGAWTPAYKETEDAYIGHPFLADGFVSKDPVTLSKKEWTPAIMGGDPVINLHIPAGGGFGDAAVEQTIKDARAFMAHHFPEYDYKGFMCASWLIDPALTEILDRETNIAKFCSRFKPMTMKSGARGVFTFIFRKTDDNFRLEDLPETSSLERALKTHFLSGGHIYEMVGYFL